jgi:hypothetical protein
MSNRQNTAQIFDRRQSDVIQYLQESRGISPA